MSKKLAFINSKGGCGKTTSIYSVVGEVSKRLRKDEKILVIDADKQMNLSFCFFGANSDTDYGERPTNTLFDFLMGEDENVISQTMWRERENAKPKYFGVDMMVADKRLANEDAMVGVDIDAVRERFEKIVAENGYKYVFVDMPPSNRTLNKIIFGSMVDSAIIPFSSDLFCIDGYGDIMEELDEYRVENPNIKVLGVFFSRFMENCLVDKFVKEELEENNINLFKTHLPLLTDVRETPFVHRPISYYRKGKSRISVEKLTTEILKKL